MMLWFSRYHVSFESVPKSLKQLEIPFPQCTVTQINGHGSLWEGFTGPSLCMFAVVMQGVSPGDLAECMSENWSRSKKWDRNHDVLLRLLPFDF